MCLIVDKTIHPDCKPLIAKEDIVVYKLLTDKHYTPYRNYRVKYFFGKAVLRAKLKRDTDFTFDSNDFCIGEGIHAHMYKIYNIINDGLLLQHKAIIPKGTKYFIGINHDIVAEKMIVYKKVVK